MGRYREIEAVLIHQNHVFTLPFVIERALECSVRTLPNDRKPHKKHQLNSHEARDFKTVSLNTYFGLLPHMTRQLPCAKCFDTVTAMDD
eukprot:5844374-Pleurochrysis_carterae.AAC.4